MERKLLSLLLTLTLLLACGTMAFAAAPAYSDNELPIIPIGGKQYTQIEGTSVGWNWNEDGTLTIAGEGAMPALAAEERPWNDKLDRIKKLVIENGVTAVCDGAFAGCTALESATLPASLTSIGEEAFSGCGKLASFTLPDALARIGAEAFTGTKYAEDNTKNGVLYKDHWLLKVSTTVAEVKLDAGTTGIADEALIGCSKLDSLSLPSSICFIGKDILKNSTYALTDANWTGDLLYLGKWLIAAKPDIEKAEILSDTVGIADSVFEGNTALLSLSFTDKKAASGSALRFYGARSFYGCTGLTGLPIPDGTERIGDEAFRRCLSLTEVVVPYSVSYIGDNAFADCDSLDKLTLYNEVCVIAVPRETLGVPGQTVLYGKKDSTAQKFAALTPTYTFRELAASDYCQTHDWGDWAVKTAPTAAAEGQLEIFCLHCGSADHATLPKLNSTDYTVTETVKATCTAEGTGKYTWKQTNYGTFSFDAATPKIAHDYTFTEKTKPTLTSEGLLDGTCKVCKATGSFSLPKLNETDYTYSVVTKPTCSATGTGRYTLKNTATYGTRTYDVTLEKTAHSWGTPTYTWSTDNKTVTATRSCSVCKQSETKTAASTSQSTATCTVAGKTTFTALFPDSGYSTQTKTVDAAALGHVDANKDNKCDRCGTVIDGSKTSPDTGFTPALAAGMLLLGTLGTALPIRKLRRKDS